MRDLAEEIRKLAGTLLEELDRSASSWASGSRSAGTSSAGSWRTPCTRAGARR